MCFSAEVSYGSAALLVTTGAVASVGNRRRSQRMIAAIPFLFGLQQLAEGVVWQTVGQDSSRALNQFAVLMFLFFANAIWPSWIPWSLYFVEAENRRRKILKALGFVGLTVTLIAVVVLLNNEVKAEVSGHSLSYYFVNLKRYWKPNFDILLYLTPTVVSFFITSSKELRRAGYFIFASLILAQIINQETTASVWCFFAAAISLVITVHVLWRQKYSSEIKIL